MSRAGSWNDRSSGTASSSSGQGTQDHLVQVLVQELVAAQTESWAELSLMVFAVDGERQSFTSATGRERMAYLDVHDPTSAAFWDALTALRALMARPGAGTWFTMRLDVSADGPPRATFDFDNEPNFVPPIDPACFVRDVEQFPRDVGQRPAWLLERLSWGVLTPEQWKLAEIGRDAVGGATGYGGRVPFTVTVTAGNVGVREDWTGRRAVVAPDGTILSVDPI